MPITIEKQTETDPCLNGETDHDWVLEMPNGPTSPGVCRKCGAEGEFKNSFLEGELASWNDLGDPEVRAARRAARLALGGFDYEPDRSDWF